MAKTYKPVFTPTVLTEDVQYTNADSASTTKALYTAGTEGGVVNDISVTSTDTSDVDLQLLITPNGGSARLIGTVTIPAGSGTDGTLPTINLLDSILMPFLQSDGSIPVEALGVISILNVTQVTAAKEMDIVAYVGSYL